MAWVHFPAGPYVIPVPLPLIPGAVVLAALAACALAAIAVEVADHLWRHY